MPCAQGVEEKLKVAGAESAKRAKCIFTFHFAILRWFACIFFQIYTSAWLHVMRYKKIHFLRR